VATLDIKTSLTRLLPSSGQVDNPLELQPDQQLTVKVISRLAEKNTFLVNYAGKTIAAKANQTIQAGIGQQLKLQVLKIQPAVILEILNAPAKIQPGNSQGASSPALLQFTPGAASAKPAQQPLWSLGQQINAKIVHIDNQKILLQIDIKAMADGKSNVPAKPPAGTGQFLQTAAARTALPNNGSNIVVTLPAAAGQGQAYKTGLHVRLQVVQPGPEPAFKILPQAQQVQETITTALRQLLPSQSAPTLFLEQIQEHVAQSKKAEQLPETLQRLARLILSELPGRKQLQSAASLKQAVQDSGLFLETKLALGKPEKLLRQDFKGKLLNFLQAMQRTKSAAEQQPAAPGKALPFDELRQKTEGTLAKLMLDQLSSLPREDNPKQLWNLELPYIDQEETQSVQLTIEREKHQEQRQDDPNWSVTISIAPPLLGLIHCRLSFCDKALNTQFWSERTGTAELIEDNLEYLQQQIEAAGLKTGLLRVNQGLPEPPGKTGKENWSLFDDQA